jgi:hypothetical protein
VAVAAFFGLAYLTVWSLSAPDENSEKDPVPTNAAKVPV